MQEQLIAVFVALVAEPLIRAVKGQFNLSGAWMLVFTVAVAAAGAAGIVLQQSGVDGLTFESFVALVPTIFAVGQIVFASIKIARAE